MSKRPSEPGSDGPNLPLEEIGRHLAEAAHDLRNPLASILALSDLLARGGRREDPAELGRRIAENARHCRAIVEDLLRLASGARAEFETVALGDLVGDLLTRRASRASGPRIAFTSPGFGARVRGIPSELARVVENLVGNAEEVMAEAGRDGRIAVSVRERPDGQVELNVCDEGPGIPEDLLPRIFEPFARGRVGGTGLGLAVCARVVEEHGGAITAENAPQGGACFRILLPALDESAPAPIAPKSAAAPDASPATPPEPLRILVVDDDRNTVETYRRVLALDGHEVVSASRGEEGLNLLLSEPFDLALVDVRLPDLSGPRFHERLRQVRPDRAARLVFATGDWHKEETRAFLNASGCPYLIKPFEIDELRAAVRLATDNRSRP
ncbi:MAG: hybrid sensor histidine kinase/response regulator [Planctomycetota bacterium]